MTFWGPWRCMNMGERKGNLMHLATQCHRISMISSSNINVSISLYLRTAAQHLWSTSGLTVFGICTANSHPECFQEFWGPPWPPATSPLLRYSFLARAIQLNVGKPGNGSPTRKGCSTNNINGILDSQGWGWTKSCFFGDENDVRPWFFSAPVGLLALESSDTGHGVGVGVLPLLPYILFWFSERDFAGRSCSFSSMSSFRCILWLLELQWRGFWVVLVTVGRATLFPSIPCVMPQPVFFERV